MIRRILYIFLGIALIAYFWMVCKEIKIDCIAGDATIKETYGVTPLWEPDFSRDKEWHYENKADKR